jgi:glycosyltransferase involved in cell wall biosynthesis
VRILHLSDRLSDRGGAHRHLLSIVRAQAERGHEVHVAAGEDDLAEAVPARRHRVDALDSRTPRAVDLDALWRAFAPDVTHVHTVINPVALAAAADRGAVFTVQDHRAFCPARGKWTAAGEACRDAFSRDVCAACFDDGGYFDEMLGLTRARLAAIRPSHVVVLSEYMRGELVQAGLAPPRVHVVPPFVDFASEAASPADPPCVLFVGRLVAAKGPLDAVEAWRRSGVALPLIVAGTGPLRERVEAAGAEVLGWVPHDHLPALLRRARALLMPSRWQEPFGIAGLEGLSLGAPVVAWESGGIREWHPGPLVSWGDVDGLAAALRSAVETRAVAPAGFQREVAMDRLESVYAAATRHARMPFAPLAPPAL